MGMFYTLTETTTTLPPTDVCLGFTNRTDCCTNDCFYVTCGDVDDTKGKIL